MFCRHFIPYVLLQSDLTEATFGDLPYRLSF